MSNFMHKVKEAVSDHQDKERVPDNEATGTHHTHRSTNPYAKDPVASQNNPSMMKSEPGPGAGRDFNSHGAARGPDTHGSATTGENTTNAGPHNSKLANKMDPRVDSDVDHRSGPGTTGSQNVGGAPKGMNANNMPPTGQPRTYGTDHHTAEEDDFNKSTQERKARTQPGIPGVSNQSTSEDTYSSSTQEHKAHSSTSHETPCEKGTRAEPGLDSRSAQPEFGGGAAGGSSYNQPTEPSGMQNANRTGKGDPQMQGMGYQQNAMDNQRGGY